MKTINKKDQPSYKLGSLQHIIVLFLFAMLLSITTYSCSNDDDTTFSAPTCTDATDTDGDGLTDCEETTGVDDPNTTLVPDGTSDPNDADDPNPQTPDFSGTYVQEDQMGRPAINTVFVDMVDKDTFNVTIPSEQSADFQTKFENKLLALNPGYTTNALTFTAEQFTTALATDVLTVSLNGTTTFFDGTNVLTGRALADDVITVELTLIFGGPDALTGNPTNPGLIDDNVDSNDKAFLTSFPYLASPW